MELACGDIIDDRYQITLLLGEGGMGSVYKAFDPTLDRWVAIKILKTHPGAVLEQAVESQFRLEGKILSKLSHPHLLSVYQLGICRTSKIPYIVTEYLEGKTLREVLDNEGKVVSAKCLTMALQICHAMIVVHEAHIVHRDLKPNNIMLLNYPDEIDAKVLDFGIAKLISTPKSKHNTRTGSIVGSPFYMSPEQFRGRKVDYRSDVYSLGCVLYECISGEPPFSADNIFGLMRSHATQQAKSLRLLSEESLPEGLPEIIRRCMQKNPDERYQTMEQLLFDLRIVAAGAGDGDDMPTKPAERGNKTIVSVPFARGPVIFFFAVFTIGMVLLLPSPFEWFRAKTADSAFSTKRGDSSQSDTDVSRSLDQRTYLQQCDAAFKEGRYRYCAEQCRHYVEQVEHQRYMKDDSVQRVWAMLLEARCYDKLGSSSSAGPKQDGYFAQTRALVDEIFKTMERHEVFLADGNTLWSETLGFSFVCGGNGPHEADALYKRLLSTDVYADPRRLRQLQFARAVYLMHLPEKYEPAKHEFVSLIKLDEKLYGTASLNALADELCLFELMTSVRDRNANGVLSELLTRMENPKINITISYRWLHLLIIGDQAAKAGNCRAAEMMLKRELQRSDYQPFQTACLHGHLAYVYELASSFANEARELERALHAFPQSNMEPMLLSESKWSDPVWWTKQLAVLKEERTQSNEGLKQILIASDVIESKSVAAATGRVFYVSKSRRLVPESGVNTRGDIATGADWQHAWQELDQINWSKVTPGSTIIIDGGDNNTGMTYTRPLTVQANGKQNQFIIIVVAAKRPLHSGKVVISRGINIGAHRYIEIIGKPLDPNSKTLSSANSNTTITSSSTDAAVNIDAEADNIVVSNIEIKNSARGLHFSGGNLSFNNLIVHDNRQNAIMDTPTAISPYHVFTNCWFYNTAANQSDGPSWQAAGKDNGYYEMSNCIFGPNLSNGVNFNAIGGCVNFANNLMINAITSNFTVGSKAMITENLPSRSGIIKILSCTSFLTLGAAHSCITVAPRSPNSSSNRYLVSNGVFRGGSVDVPGDAKNGDTSSNVQDSTTGNTLFLSRTQTDSKFTSKAAYLNNVDAQKLVNTDFSSVLHPPQSASQTSVFSLLKSARAKALKDYTIYDAVEARK